MATTSDARRSTTSSFASGPRLGKNAPARKDYIID